MNLYELFNSFSWDVFIDEYPELANNPEIIEVIRDFYSENSRYNKSFGRKYNNTSDGIILFYLLVTKELLSEKYINNYLSGISLIGKIVTYGNLQHPLLSEVNSLKHDKVLRYVVNSINLDELRRSDLSKIRNMTTLAKICVKKNRYDILWDLIDGEMLDQYQIVSILTPGNYMEILRMYEYKTVQLGKDSEYFGNKIFNSVYRGESNSELLGLILEYLSQSTGMSTENLYDYFHSKLALHKSVFYEGFLRAGISLEFLRSKSKNDIELKEWIDSLTDDV